MRVDEAPEGRKEIGFSFSEGEWTRPERYGHDLMGLCIRVRVVKALANTSCIVCGLCLAGAAHSPLRLLRTPKESIFRSIAVKTKRQYLYSVLQ